MKPKYITQIDQLTHLSKQEQDRLKQVADLYSFRASEYYMSLVNWDDPDDPIRRTIIPSADELEQWGMLDPSGEHHYTVMPGLEHKYRSTVLLLVSNVCGGICRYCFRKRVFLKDHNELLQNLPAAMEYIGRHSEISNVLLTGGDPLILATNKLNDIIKQLRTIEHIQIIRLGTKMTAFNPHRILDDPDLLKMIQKYSTDKKKIYIMTHFNHPREITDPAVRSVNLLCRAGAILANQTPLIRGLNDRPQVLAELFKKLSFIGVPPYYVFQCRPAVGNKAYVVPIEQGYDIFEQARSMVSGLAKRARYVMSHHTGKIEIIAKDAQYTYLKYHRMPDDIVNNRFMKVKNNPQACWLNDYEEITDLDSAEKLFGDVESADTNTQV